MILCDTTVLIDILRKKLRILDLLKERSSESLFITELSVMELYFGIYSNKYIIDKPELMEKRNKAIIELCHHFLVLPFDRKAAVKTAHIMGKLQIARQMIDFRDGMIAGISIANNINNVVTRNANHFKRILELKVIEY